MSPPRRNPGLSIGTDPPPSGNRPIVLAEQEQDGLVYRLQCDRVDPGVFVSNGPTSVQLVPHIIVEKQ